MSNLGPMPGQGASRIPTPPRGEPIARYETYLEAQRAVDFLSDNAFPVQLVTIVGTGLRMVERVTGRLTYGRVAMAGAGSGLYFGFFFGLLLSLFAGSSNALIAGPLFGVAFGVLYGVIAYALTRGRRDFTSTSQIVASEYEVLCQAEHANEALAMLGRLPGGTGKAEAGPRGGAASPMTPRSPYLPVPPSSTSSSPMSPTATPAGAQRAAETEPDEPGLTYSEAIERQKRDRLQREQSQREQQG